MADNLYTPTDTKPIITETISGVGDLSITKLHNGTSGVDGGAITPLNPLDVKLDATSLAALEHITIDSQVLPIGAATETTLDAAKALLINLVASLPTALTGAGNLKVAIIEALTQLPATLGIKTAANSLSIAPASDATFNISNFPGTQAVIGTFWQATQPVSLEAGTELVGKFGIDQTTPGTTEAVTVKPTGANAPVSRSTSVAYEAGRLASSSTAVLFGLSGHNSSASGLFIQVHDSATAPADTAVPVELFYVPANSSFAFEAACQAGDTYSNGIYVCCSTTGPTKTIGGAVCWFNVRFR